MNLEDLIEFITTDAVSEGIGAAAAVGLLLAILFGGKLDELLVLLMQTLG